MFGTPPPPPHCISRFFSNVYSSAQLICNVVGCPLRRSLPLGLNRQRTKRGASTSTRVATPNACPLPIQVKTWRCMMQYVDDHECRFQSADTSDAKLRFVEPLASKLVFLRRNLPRAESVHVTIHQNQSAPLCIARPRCSKKAKLHESRSV